MKARRRGSFAEMAAEGKWHTTNPPIKDGGVMQLVAGL
jgi:hypothetical protein